MITNGAHGTDKRDTIGSPRNLAEAISADRVGTVLLLALAALAGLVALYVRIRLLNVPLERDEGEYAYIGQLILQGRPPFLDVYTLKLPGTAIMYAAFMAAFGQTPQAIHIALLVANIATTWLLWVLARDLFDVRTATASAASYVTLSLSSGVLGVFAHATHFVNLWVLAGFVLMLRSRNRSDNSLHFASGVFFGLAVLMKQHAAVLALYGLGVVAWQAREKGLLWKPLIHRCTWFTVGIATPIMLLVAWVIGAGAFDKFWTWTVQYAGSYATGGSIHDGLEGLFTQTKQVGARTWPFWVLGFLGVVPLLLRSRKGGSSTGFVFGLFVASFLAMCPGLYFRNHYFVLMLPSIAILAGLALTRGVELTIATWGRPAMGIVSGLLLLAALSGSYYLDRAYLFQSSAPEVTHDLYPQNPFLDSPAIARYIELNSAPNDRIAILGSEPQILFYAKRRSATGHIYMYGLMDDQPQADVMQRDMIAEIEAARPLFLVFANVQTSWLMYSASPKRIFHWVDDYVDANYMLTGIVEFGLGSSRYTWGGDTIGYTPRSENFVSVWKRVTSP